ncbi:MAG: tetratricopeptide repeat protein, partial [Methanosarcinales archaeon]|nr:tetratricopeptide repeat protein [Methanosarcinales archaeon]
MEYDIFFSYPRKDEKEVNLILKALQAKGLSVWIDHSKIQDYASITKSIIDGVAHSKVLLAYNSLNYAHSRACQWELTAAFLAAQREGDPRQRVLIINPVENAEHIHPVELRDELFQKAPVDQQGIDNLAASVATQVSAIKGTIGEIRTLIQPRWFGKKGTGSNRFVGRLPDMWRIHSFLHSAEVPVITGATNTTVQIHGIGGVGKSLLAEEYALRYAAAFPGGVFWLRAFGNDDVKTAMGPDEREAERIRQVRDIAAAYGIPVNDRSPEEIESQLARELGNNGPFLWVVDDVPSDMNVETLERWLAPHPLGKTLITTRTKEYNFLGNLIPLDVLAPDEAWELLTSWRKPAGEEEEDAARQLIKDLGFHALALDVTGAALHASEGIQSFAEFREELASPTRDELELAAELKGVLPNDHQKSIASTLIRSIERLGPEGRDLLRLASVLAVAPIPASLILSVFSEVDSLDEVEGRRRAILGLDQTENLSLAERVDDEPNARSVHTLISRTMRFHDTRPERTDQLETAAIKMLTNELSKADDPHVHGELRLTVTHARELVSRSDDIQAAGLMGQLARFDYVRGVYASAENLFRRQCKLQRTILGAEHPSTLTSMNNLALTLGAQGDLEGARKIQEQVLEISRRILSSEHPNTLRSMNNL